MKEIDNNFFRTQGNYISIDVVEFIVDATQAYVTQRGLDQGEWDGWDVWE